MPPSSPSDERTVIPLQTPICNLYLIRGTDGYMLIDAGTGKHYGAILRAIKRAGVDLAEVKWVLATHEHPDHVGALARLQAEQGWTVICHAEGVQALREGHVIIPPTRNFVGRVTAILGMSIKWLLGFPKVEPDMVISGETSLEPLGFAAYLVHTPGHSPGSMSVVLETGEACVGDLMGDRRIPPPGPPLFGDSLEQVYESWRVLLRRGVRVFYTGHGKAVPAEKVRVWLEQAGEPVPDNGG